MFDQKIIDTNLWFKSVSQEKILQP